MYHPKGHTKPYDKGPSAYQISKDDHVPYFTMCQKFKRIPGEALKI